MEKSMLDFLTAVLEPFRQGFHDIRTEIVSLKEEIKCFYSEIKMINEDKNKLEMKIMEYKKDFTGFVERYEIRHKQINDSIEKLADEINGMKPEAKAKRWSIYIGLALASLAFVSSLIALFLNLHKAGVL